MEPRLADITRLHALSEASGDLVAAVLAKSIVSQTRGNWADEFTRLRPHRTKAAVPALTTSAVGSPSTEYAALVRRRSLLGRIPLARPVPPMTRLNALSTGATASFITEGQPIPLSALSFDTPVILRPGKLASIVPFTAALVKHSDPAAFASIERDLVRALATGQDTALLDGAAAVEGGRPASILSGVSATGGGSPSSTESDIAALVAAVRSGESEAPVFITSMTGALYLAQARESNGERMFPDVHIVGGTLLGAPLLISPAAGAKLIFLDGAALYYSDGGVELDTTSAAAFQFSDTPTPGTANVVSLWQTNSIAVRSIQYVSWQALANAVAYAELPV